MLTPAHRKVCLAILLMLSTTFQGLPQPRLHALVVSKVSDNANSQDNFSGAPVALPAPRPLPPPQPLEKQRPNVPNVVSMSATLRDSFPNHGDGKAHQGDTITYSVAITNSGDTAATGVQYSDTVDVNTSTLVGGSPAIQFTMTGDTYSAIGNVQLNTSNIAAGSGQTVLENDTLNGATLSGFGNSMATANNTVPNGTNTVTTTNGGTITMNADGSFKYNPAAGFGGAGITDTFWYTLTKNIGTGNPNGFPRGSARVTINVSTPIWFVNSAAPVGGNGRLTSPFNCYTGTSGPSQTCFSDTAADDPGDVIFLFSGSYTGGNTLLNNQKLVGAGASDTLANIAGVTVPPGSDALPATGGANPTITTTVAATNAINLGSGNTLRGFTVGNTTGSKIGGSAFGTLIVGNSTTPDVTLNGTGQALALTNGTLSLAGKFSAVATSSSAGQGIFLSQVADSDGAGGGSFSFGSTTVSGSTTQGILVQQSTGDINFGNTTVGTAVAGSGGTNAVALQNNSAGTRTFGTLTIQNINGPSNSAFLSSTGGGGTGGGNTVAGTTNISGVAGTGNGIDIQSLAAGTSVQFGDTTVNKASPGSLVNLGGATTGNAGTVTFLSLGGTNSAGPGFTAAENTGQITVTNASATNLSGTNGVAIGITKAAAPVTPVDLDFANVSASGGANAINLQNVSGTITATGGALSGTATVFNVSGGSVSVTYSGGITQANNAAAVSVAGGHTGTLTFNTGTINVTNGTGLQFDNADGTYNFNGTNTLNGGDAGVDILNGSAGTFSFSSNTSITNPTGTCFTANGSTAGVTFSGNMTKSGTSTGLLVDVTNEASGTITFQTGTLSSTSSNGTGIQLSNADGTVNFNGTNTLNGGNAGVDIITGCAGTFTFSANSSITNPTGIAYNEDTSTANVTYNGTISQNNAASAVRINAKTGGTTAFNKATGGQIMASTTTANAIDLTNTGGTVNFTGGLGLTTTAGIGFNASGSGATVSATQNNTTIVNTLTTTTGTALNVANTTIGASNLTFHSISVTGNDTNPSSGIVLNNTGSSGGLIVTGNGNITVGGDSSGGIIQHTSSHGISLTLTKSPSFTNIKVQNTPGSGIKGVAAASGGAQVTNFTLHNSTIDTTGTGGGVDESNVGFNIVPSANETNLTGTISITQNALTNSRYHGFDLQQFGGTITSLDISNNTLTSSTSGVNSLGSAVLITVRGTAAAAGSINGATIKNNTITNFPSGGGIIVQAGNGTSSGSPGCTLGTLATPVQITGNTTAGPAGVRMATQGVNMAIDGVGTSQFDISNNNVSNVQGVGVAYGAFGAVTAVGTINNNSVNSNSNVSGQPGFAVGVDQHFAITDAPSLKITSMNGNSTQNTQGNGILLTARSSHGSLLANVTSSNVAAPLAGVRPGIRVDSGNNTAGENTSVCVNLTGNTTAGSGGTNGIGLRKQGTSTSVDTFSVVGMAATSSPGVETYVSGLNPAGNGVLLISATSGFGNCGTISEITKPSSPDQQSYLASTEDTPRHTSSDSWISLLDLSTKTLFNSLFENVVQPRTRVRTSGSESPTTLALLKGAFRPVASFAAQSRTLGPQIDYGLTPKLRAATGRGITPYVNKDVEPKTGEMFITPAAWTDSRHWTEISSSETNIATLQNAGLRSSARFYRDSDPAGLEEQRSEVRYQRSALKANHVQLQTSSTQKPLTPQSGGTVNLSVGTIPAGSTAVLTFQVTVNNVAPSGASQISNQGTVSGTGFASVLTDDPDTVAANDATITPLLHPTASGAVINGRITDTEGKPVEGTVVNLSGTQTRKTITDANGFYGFKDVETGGFYTVTPSRVNYNFNPFNRSFSQVGNQTEALFDGAFTGDAANPLDTAEYFVRQQYVDILNREPDEAGFNYWSDHILACGNDAACIRSERTGVAAAFFIEQEFRQSAAFIYDVYESALGRRPSYNEYTGDRSQIVGGPTLDTLKLLFAESFVARAEFVTRYENNLTAESFVDALLANAQAAGINLSSQRDSLIAHYNTGTSLTESRAFVVRDVSESTPVQDANYNSAFVVVEYFGYLQRNPEQAGYVFWLNVLNNGDPGNYRGMVCSFVTSAEYQHRFSSVVSHSNSECGP